MIRRIICFLGKILFSLKKQRKTLNPEKILIIRSGAIGDIIMTTPFLKAVRKRFPKAKISYLVGEWSKNILEGNKNINKIIPFDDKIVYKKKLFGVIRLIKKIRKEKFDLCFILDKSYHWGILAFLFKIKTRIGFNRLGEGFANNINTPYNGTKYELDYYLELAKKIGADTKDKKMEIPLSKEEKSFADNFISNIKGKIIGIAPGGAKNPGQEMVVKRWPVEKYIKLMNILSKKYKIIILGGPGDEGISKRISSETTSKNIFDTTGKTTLKQSAALMKKCSLFITHDSGPMHMAAAVGVKVIALFGPTPAVRFAPRNAAVIESKLKPCYDIYGDYRKCKITDCMKDIKIEEVLRKLQSSI